MDFEWDEGKDRANRAKHGIGLADAVRLDWREGRELIDQREAYGEVRIRRYALIDNRLHVCVYTLREDRLRIISLRKANRREVRDHGD